jgi:hypothetical protein
MVDIDMVRIKFGRMLANTISSRTILRNLRITDHAPNGVAAQPAPATANGWLFETGQRRVSGLPAWGND